MKTVSLKIKSNSKGNNFVINGTDWRILSDGLKGFDTPNFSVYSETSALIEGSIITAKNVDSRNLVIEFESRLNQNTDVLRHTLIDYFNLISLYNITINYRGRERIIKGATLDIRDIQVNNAYSSVKAKLGFFCPDPYFTSTTQVSIANTGSGSTWYYSLEGDAPTPFSLTYYANSSSTSATIYVRSYHYDYTMQSPSRIYNTMITQTGQTYSTGDTISIPDSSKLEIRKNGTALPINLTTSFPLMLYPHYSSGGHYLSLSPGRSYSSSSASGTISYYPKFLGI